MSELLNLFGQASQVVSQGISAWGASKAQHREWSFQKAMSAYRDGIELLSLTVQQTGDFTQHQGIYENGGLYNPGENDTPVQVAGINDLKASVIEQFGTDPYVANALEVAWPGIEQTAQSYVREYSHNQEMIYEGARIKDDMSKLWFRMQFGDYESAVKDGTALLESGRRTGVFNDEQVRIQRNQFMAQGVDRLKADLQVITTNGTDTKKQIHAINTAIDGGLAAGLFRSTANAENIRQEFVYGVRFDGLKAELLASVWAAAEVSSGSVIIDGETTQMQALSRAERLNSRFDQAMQTAQDPSNHSWLTSDDRVALVDILRQERTKARADMNYDRDMFTQRMTDEVRSLDDGTPEGIGRVISVLDTAHYRTRTNHNVWYPLWDRYNTELEGESAAIDDANMRYDEAVLQSTLATIFREATTGTADFPSLMVEINRMLPSWEDSVYTNREGEEVSYRSPVSGLLSPDAARVWRNFLTDVKDDPITASAVSQLQNLAKESGLNDDEIAPYLGQALTRLEEVMRRFNYRTDPETGDVERNPERDALSASELTQVVQQVWDGVGDDIRRSDAWKIYRELPEELADFEEVPDRQRRLLGINLGTAFTQDQTEELVERLFTGDLPWAERTYGSRMGGILDSLESELETRFVAGTGADVIRTTRSEKTGLPMFRAQMSDGQQFWFSFRYEEDRKRLIPTVAPLDDGSRPWVDVDIERMSPNGQIYARNYNGGW